jgi:hypothetical protein
MTLLMKKQLVLLALVVGARCFTLYAIPDEVESAAKVTRLALPNTIDNWRGKDVKVDPFVYEVLHPEAVLQKRYVLAAGPGETQPIEAEVLAMYTRDVEGFHPPDVCMESQGWVIGKHEQREVSANGKTLNLEVITGEQRDMKKELAYCFTDPSGAVSGRTINFAKMVLARFIRRRVGTVEMQFAYDRRALLPNGDYKPEFKKLMVTTASQVYRQLGTPKPPSQ